MSTLQLDEIMENLQQEHLCELVSERGERSWCSVIRDDFRRVMSCSAREIHTLSRAEAPTVHAIKVLCIMTVGNRSWIIQQLDGRIYGALNRLHDMPTEERDRICRLIQEQFQRCDDVVRRQLEPVMNQSRYIYRITNQQLQDGLRNLPEADLRVSMMTAVTSDVNITRQFEPEGSLRTFTIPNNRLQEALARCPPGTDLRLSVIVTVNV